MDFIKNKNNRKDKEYIKKIIAERLFLKNT